MVRRVAGRYVLGEQLGAGGTSRVHAALDERLGRQVAVKLLDAHLARSADPAGRERFLREGPTSASFSHRHVITVFDAGEDDGDLYIVMELVDGPSLAEHLARTGPLPTATAVRIIRQVLAALAAAHTAGIVHRDVKPANVLIGADGDIKLADFGIATRFDDLAESVTSTGLVIGTPRYLAPERLLGSPATPVTDVYGVGVILFEMLVGRPPFAADTPAAIATAQRTQSAPDVRSFRDDVSASLAGVVARALSADPADRYPSAVEMDADLAAAWSPPSPPPPEADVLTQVMGVVEAERAVEADRVVEAERPPVVGVRSGDTQIMPVAAPVPPASPARDTTAENMPAENMPAAPPHRSSRRAVVAVAVVAVLIAFVAGAFGLGSNDRAPTMFTDPSATSTPRTAATSAVSTSTRPTPSTTSRSSTLPDLIPGFPQPSSLADFLSTLQSDPTLVGSSGPALVSELSSVLAQKSPKKRSAAATTLRRVIAQWVDDGTLNPTVASALDDLLAAA